MLDIGLGLSCGIQGSPRIPGATLDMNFIQNDYVGAKPTDLTTARASNGYGTTPSGLLINFANNIPRIVAGQGLLIEFSRTNSLLQSNTLNNAAWTATTMSVVASATISPDGTANAWTLTASAGNATLKQGVATTAVPWTNSVWLRRVSGTGNIDITMDGVTWVTQTLTTAWQRFSVAQTGVAGTSNPGIRIVTNGDVIEAFGEQAEAGAFASSYIPTAGATATRATDNVMLAGAAYSAAVSGASGVWFAEGIIVNNTGGSQTRRLIDVTDGTANNRILLGKATTNQPRYLVAAAAATQADIFNATSFVTTPFKMAARFNNNDFQEATMSVLGVADVAGSVPTVTQCQFGLDVLLADTACAYSYIRRVGYIPGVQPDALLQWLSAP